jgi:hypothetical protein
MLRCPVLSSHDAFRCHLNLDACADDGSSQSSSNQIGSPRSGTSTPAPATATGSAMRVRFTSDGSYQGTGFVATMTCAATASTYTYTYTYFAASISWMNARTQCLASGGDLASIHSAQQNAAVQTAAGGSNAWIGLSDSQTEGVWLWSDGTPFGYSNWAAGEPNDFYTNEDHVKMQPSGLWNDAGPHFGTYIAVIDGYVCGYTSCSSGQHVSGSSCASCPAGRYQALSSHTSSNCTACAAGRYRSSTGGTSSNSCSVCPSGRTSSAGASSCTTVTCGSGQYVSGSSCASCPAGRYQALSSHTSSSCTACAAGTYVDFTGSSVCPSCSSGTTSFAGASSCVRSDTGVSGHPVSTTFALVSHAASDKATSVAASLTLPIPAAAASAILDSPTVRASFKVSFETDMAAKLGSSVSPSDVTVTSIVAGSLKVDFDVHASGGNVLPDAAATLSAGPIAFSTLSSDPIVSAAVGTTFSTPIAPAAVTAAYNSNACANAASICGSHATCATMPSGFQCTCNAGYGTSPAANMAASCAQPAPLTASLKTSADGSSTESEASSGLPLVPIVAGASGLFLICASIAVFERCSHSSRNKVTVIEAAETHDENQTVGLVVPMANAPVANVPTANASPIPADSGTKTLLLMQQQTAMQQSLVQQQSMMQQQHMQHMEREAHQERAERAAAQERADRQASLERVHIHSAHSEVTPALQAANAIPTAEALAANSTDEPPDTLARQSTAEMVAVLRHKGYNVTDEPGIAEDTSVQEAHPKEDDNRSPSRTEDSVPVVQQTAFSASALSALSVKQLRGAYTPLCHDHRL